MLVDVAGCAPNRAQWMQQEADRQAKLGTSSIGSEQNVKEEARQAASLLKDLATGFLAKPPVGKEQLAAAWAQEFSIVASGLDDIADSRTDEQFTAAVFEMCDPQRRQAAPQVGKFMNVMAGALSAKPPPNVSNEEVQQSITYCQTFGERLIGIPAKCEHASAAMAEASAEEQQAETEHQANLNAAATTTAIVLGAALITAGSVAAAEASRPIIVPSPPVENNYYISRQPVVAPWPQPLPSANISPMENLRQLNP
jgi:hypothetical protein